MCYDIKRMSTTQKNPNYEADGEELRKKNELFIMEAVEKARKILAASAEKASNKVSELLDIDENLTENQGRGRNIQLKASLALLKGIGVTTEKVTHEGEVNFTPLKLRRSSDDEQGD